MNLLKLIKQERDAEILETIKDIDDQRDLKITCLIRLGKFAEAQRLLESSHLENDARNSYCLLKLNQEEKALKGIENLESKKGKLLKAQILNRLENVQALEIYKELEQDSDIDEDTRAEIVANELGVVASFGLNEIIVQSEDLENFEQAFNYSTLCIHKGQIEEAEKILKLAEKLITDMDQDSMQFKLVQIQKSVIFQIKGLKDQALESLKEIDVTKVDDNSKYVIKHNLNQDFSGTSKKVNLTLVQKRILKYNQLLLELVKIPELQANSGKLNSLKEKVVDALKKDSQDENLQKLHVSLILKSRGRVIQELKKLVHDNPSSKIYNLALVQYYMEKRDLKGGKEAFKEFFNGQLDNFRFRPGMVSLFVFLAQEVEDILWIFKESIAFWRMKQELIPLTILLKKSAQYKLSLNMYQEAAVEFKEVLEIEKDDSNIAGLISAYAGYDPLKAKEYYSKLPLISIPSNVDVERLESFEDFLVYFTLSNSSKTEKTRKKRKRTIKYPKNYDPSATPDPERWIPKRERSSFLKKKKGKKEITGLGSQGSQKLPFSDSTILELPKTESEIKLKAKNPLKKKKKR